MYMYYPYAYAQYVYTSRTNRKACWTIITSYAVMLNSKTLEKDYTVKDVGVTIHCINKGGIVKSP